MRDAGKAVLLVSVELDEILSLSDRILVMFDGQVVGEISAAQADEKTLGLMMANIVPEHLQVKQGSSMSQQRIPLWVNVGLIPLVNLIMAFAVSALLFAYIDINPLDAVKIMWEGAFGYAEGIGFTLLCDRLYLYGVSCCRRLSCRAV